MRILSFSDSLILVLGIISAGCMSFAIAVASEPVVKISSTWPQPYSVTETADALILSTPYYVVAHDLKRGGVITRIRLTHGRAANLLASPVETRVVTADGVVLTDVNDTHAKVMHQPVGLNQIVTVECALANSERRPSGIHVRTTYEYRWGYVRIHKEFLLPDTVRVREVCPFTTVLTPGLTEYGYRTPLTDEEHAPDFDFGASKWGRLHPDDPPIALRHVPRSMIFADPGVEGLEWFVSSDLAQWDVQLTGRRGQAQCTIQPSLNPAGSAWSIAPFADASGATLKNGCAFNFYLAVPLREGHAQKPWLHTIFNRNRGNWATTEEIQGWAEKGIQTAHCHNDGDYYEDGLFWRDGSYPPYPDMDRYDQVLLDCRKAGIRTATYFSNKELHPATEAFLQNGKEWGRTNRKGDLKHNFYREKSEFGAQMCLRSGWLDFLKFSIDRVLKNHPLDGVYYDWNVALLCYNPRHEPGAGQTAAPLRPEVKVAPHWDVDELLDLMEWTRQRVGPTGLIIIHNTATPMFAMENFADYIVATEWGYDKWTNRSPDLQKLPLEWSLAGARARGVISYGTLKPDSPARLHRQFALQALLGGVMHWPVGEQALELMSLLKPIGDIETCRFADWRNHAVRLSDARCASAIYSRKNEAFLLLANLDEEAKEITCALHPNQLPYPLAALSEAVQLENGSPGRKLDVSQLPGPGVSLSIPGDGAMLIQVR